MFCATDTFQSDLRLDDYPLEGLGGDPIFLRQPLMPQKPQFCGAQDLPSITVLPLPATPAVVDVLHSLRSEDRPTMRADYSEVARNDVLGNRLLDSDRLHNNILDASLKPLSHPARGMENILRAGE
ncbi:hypothetical protein PsYK624_122240 [Phanerochaete sordida]|uniref:Uncharacterized protein n=1 Tax=Phanerochaete sordida TaxID=48140 RepID=A0A9P3GJP7_9APHY|nr:hypothetical protein PsYK624_122240 [Phanerochaete sordida]